MKPERIAHYEKLGWEFEVRDEVDNHNGDIDTYYYIRSPRIKKLLKRDDFEFSSRVSFDKMDEQKMLADETEFYVKQRVKKMKDGYRWDEPIIQALLNDPEAKSITVTLEL